MGSTHKRDSLARSFARGAVRFQSGYDCGSVRYYLFHRLSDAQDMQNAILDHLTCVRLGSVGADARVGIFGWHCQARFLPRCSHFYSTCGISQLHGGKGFHVRRPG